VATSVVPGRGLVTDSRNLMFCFRLMSDRTLVFGGRADITGRRDAPPSTRDLRRASLPSRR
jgi:hypothetical protein